MCVLLGQIGCLSNPLELCWIIFPASFAGQGALYEDPTAWLDRAIPPPISLIMTLANSQLDKLGPYYKIVC
jgi:hypothetical protein